MKVIYDRETDSLVITLRDAPIRESDEVRPGVIANFGKDGGVIRFEVLRLAGRRGRRAGAVRDYRLVTVSESPM